MTSRLIQIMSVVKSFTGAQWDTAARRLNPLPEKPAHKHRVNVRDAMKFMQPQFIDRPADRPGQYRRSPGFGTLSVASCGPSHQFQRSNRLRNISCRELVKKIGPTLNHLATLFKKRCAIVNIA